MKFDIVRFLETLHPLRLIFIGLFMISVGLNFAQYNRNTKLLKQLEANCNIQIIFVPKDQPYLIPKIEEPEDLSTSIL